MSERRKFSNEFKREAVELTRSANVTVSQVARELGVNATLLSKWRRQLEREGEKAFPGQGNARDEEIVALKRELSRVKRERDFLKEAALSSTGHRNTSLKFICGRTEIQSFPGPLVQAQCYLVQL